ncbi:MAG TPA: GrpB family protein [Coleofasciculaceae cyanobacterium]
MENPVLVVDYDANWPMEFEQEKIQILNALDNAVMDIQHVGSTSVPGLAAKPIIDIAVGLKQIPPSLAQIEALEKLGSVHRGEAGIPGRHFFGKGMPSTHHIHVAKLGAEFWERHILFRDFLRAHPDAAQQYEALKRDLAIQFRCDRQRYTDSKTPLIEQLLVQARAWQQG